MQRWATVGIVYIQIVIVMAETGHGKTEESTNKSQMFVM